jgi:phosphoesterase RecJ-like protein
MQNIDALITLLKSPQKIVITTHIKPDADALGSSLGLAGYLQLKGHEVKVVAPSDYPEFLNWMVGNADVVVYKEETKDLIASAVESATLIFCLDFSSLKRIEEVGVLVKKSSAKKVLIDHHLNPEIEVDFMLWDVNASATAELVYDLIKSFGDIDLVNPELAECLYAGMLTDTGGFKHSNTSAKVHRTVADLIDRGANVTLVNKIIYDNNSLNRLKLIGFALAERLVVMPKFNVAYFTLSLADLSQFDYKTGDTEGLVNYALSIKGILMAAIMIEDKDKVKMSFRSFGDVSVNDIAAENFDGGGHKNAAGGVSRLSLEATVAKFREIVNNHKEKFNHKTIGNA